MAWWQCLCCICLFLQTPEKATPKKENRQQESFLGVQRDEKQFLDIDEIRGWLAEVDSAAPDSPVPERIQWEGPENGINPDYLARNPFLSDNYSRLLRQPGRGPKF